MNLRLLSFVFASLLLVDIAVAQPATTTRSRKAPPTQSDLDAAAVAPRRVRIPSPYLLKGFGLGLGLVNITNKADVGASVSGSAQVPIDRETRTSGNAAFTANYSLIQRDGFGFTTDLTYSQVQKIISDQPYSFLRPSVNVAFGADRYFYGFAGANYMSFLDQPTGVPGSVLDGTKINLNTQIGWQAGIGAAYQSFLGQLQYVSSRVTVDQAVSTTGGVPIQFAGAYDFSGVEFALQYRF